jgi:hypothetical protein
LGELKKKQLKQLAMNADRKEIETNLNLRQEYAEVNQNLRHYGNMRFAQLTIFIALTGGLIVFVFTKLNPVSQLEIIIAFEVLGIFISIMFLIIERSSTMKWISFKERSNDLEKLLNYRQLTESTYRGKWNATRAIKV